MACRLDGAKSLSEPRLAYCWLDPTEQTSVKILIKIQTFPWKKICWKMSSAKCCPLFRLGLSVLRIRCILTNTIIPNYKDKVVLWYLYLQTGNPHIWKNCLYIEPCPSSLEGTNMETWEEIVAEVWAISCRQSGLMAPWWLLWLLNGWVYQAGEEG